MKAKADKFMVGVSIAALPLLVAVGCAGNGQNMSQTESASQQISNNEPHTQQQDEAMMEQTTATAIANMEGYVAQLIEDASPTEAADPVEKRQSEPVGAADSGDQEGADEYSHGSMTDEELLVAEVQGEGPEIMPASIDDEEKVVSPPPQKTVFHFGFDKKELDAADVDVIKQHAAYLLQHPTYTLVISGHTDNRGDKRYNQQLSEQRAQQVAKLLLAEGVPESQLQVAGMGDAVPRVSPDHWQENRRVEVVYQDSMMAHNQ